jgi:hypothetical protein
VAFTEDLAPFFDTAAGFAVTVVYGDITLAGILLSSADPVLGVQASSPRLICPAVAVIEAQKGDILTIGGVDYELAEPPRPDGTGLAELTLNTLD